MSVTANSIRALSHVSGSAFLASIMYTPSPSQPTAERSTARRVIWLTMPPTRNFLVPSGFAQRLKLSSQSSLSSAATATLLLYSFHAESSSVSTLAVSSAMRGASAGVRNMPAAGKRTAEDMSGKM